MMDAAIEKARRKKHSGESTVDPVMSDNGDTHHPAEVGK